MRRRLVDDRRNLIVVVIMLMLQFFCPLHTLCSLTDQVKHDHADEIDEEVVARAEHIALMHPFDRLELVRVASYHQ